MDKLELLAKLVAGTDALDLLKHELTHDYLTEADVASIDSDELIPLVNKLEEVANKIYEIVWRDK